MQQRALLEEQSKRPVQQEPPVSTEPVVVKSYMISVTNRSSGIVSVNGCRLASGRCLHYTSEQWADVRGRLSNATRSALDVVHVEAVERTDITEAERLNRVVELLNALDRDDASLFTQSGAPKIAVVRRSIPDITSSEIITGWAYLNGG